MDKNRLHDWLGKRKERKNSLQFEPLYSGIKQKDNTALSAAITLIESNNDRHKDIARALIKACLPLSGKSIRIGITGVPGVGKSTFIETFGKYAIQQGHRVAVLAVDPSSEKSGGSILGDKTRMNDLSTDPNAFIRPSAAGKSLGGVARKTRESIILCEAAGYDFIIIETVGVGQSETVVHSMVDFFLLLMLTGAGDELQGIKRGIMEMADGLIITKADGENLTPAQKARVQYQNAMHLFPPNDNQWTPQSMVTSAKDNLNIDKTYELVMSFKNHTTLNGSFADLRKRQDKYWMHETITESLLRSFYEAPGMKIAIKEFEERIIKGEISSFEASDILLKKYNDEQ
jgi:LAO/AO transport system kinase